MVVCDVCKKQADDGAMQRLQLQVVNINAGRTVLSPGFIAADICAKCAKRVMDALHGVWASLLDAPKQEPAVKGVIK